MARRERSARALVLCRPLRLMSYGDKTRAGTLGATGGEVGSAFGIKRLHAPGDNSDRGKLTHIPTH